MTRSTNPSPQATARAAIVCAVLGLLSHTASLEASTTSGAAPAARGAGRRKPLLFVLLCMTWLRRRLLARTL